MDAREKGISRSHTLRRPFQFTVFISENVKLHRTRIEKARSLVRMSVWVGVMQVHQKFESSALLGGARVQRMGREAARVSCVLAQNSCKS